MMKILFDGRNLTAECTHKKGVYCWLNTTNGKKYIGLAGGSKGLKGRLSNIKRFALEVGVPQASLNHVWRERLHYNTCKGWRKAEEEINMYNYTKDKFWNFDRWDNR